MALITLNGIELDALAGSGDEEELEIGEGVSRAFDGSALRSVRGYKRQWSFTSVLDTPANSRGFRRLLQGRFRHWNFDADLFSDGGLGPSASSGASSVAGGLFGNALQLAATTGSITYAGIGGVASGDGFTLLIQRKESGAWHDYHLSWDYTGALSGVYKDGVVQATTLPSWITSYTHSSGTLVLNSTAGSAQLFDEMVALSFEAPLASWSTQLDVWRNSSAWSASPRLSMSGTLGVATVMGKPGKAKLQQAVVGGTFYDNAESFPFDLWEA